MQEVRVAGRYGRLPAHSRHTHPRLLLSDYMKPNKLPPTPAKVDWCSKVPSWPMYLNDQLGDCTCAAVGHQLQAWTHYAGKEVDVTDDQVLKLYEAVSGYDPATGDNDNGANIQDVMEYMTLTGIAGMPKYSFFAELPDLSNMKAVYQALYLFGSVYLGINVPESAEEQFQNGQPWSDVGDDNILGGHAIVVQQSDSSSGNLNIITWGAVQEMEPSFWEAYVEEAWVALTPEWFSAQGEAPVGLNVAAMQADFKELYG
jgi:hypothetical protein